MDVNAQGQWVLNHLGMFCLGARTIVVLVPDEQLGLAIFTNAAPIGLPEALSQTFFDLLKGESSSEDWVGIWNGRFEQMCAQQKALPKPTYVSPPLPLQAYTGTYDNAYFGPIQIKEKDQQLWLTIGPKSEQFLLTPSTRDTFSMQTRKENATGVTAVTFTMGEKGAAERVTIEAYNKFGTGQFVKNEDKR